jgi:hypothetical protein
VGFRMEFKKEYKGQEGKSIVVLRVSYKYRINACEEGTDRRVSTE